ncbi:MAG: fibronectin type III domain-containing protein, partial [Gammaproteobacteria bacterium]|nr:fibronectin type III domain-containing protein [Gammaproteobacteria bacterium]
SADTDPPTIPGNLAGTALSTSRISLTWSPSVDNVAVAGYEIRRDGTLVTTVTGTSYTDTGLAPNTGYAYTVAASDAAGNVSAESAPVAVNTLASADTDPPTVPGNLAGTALSSSRISLTWSPSVDNVAVAGYEIRRDGTLVTTVTGTSYTDTGLSPNTNYTYDVQAIDDAGNRSGSSPQISVMTRGSDQPSGGSSGGGALNVAVLAFLLSLVMRRRKYPCMYVT